MDGFKFGFALKEITPPVGTPMGGFAVDDRKSTGVYDKLYVRALAFKLGGYGFMVLSCDLLAVDDGIVSEVRREVSSLTGVDSEKLMIIATHTHSGPDIVIPMAGGVSGEYLSRLKTYIAEAAVEAYQRLKPGLFTHGKGLAEVGFNRRTGSKPIDPELSVLRFDHLDNRFTVLAVNYACHPVVLGGGNRLISADYPGFLVKAVKNGIEARGFKAEAFFLNGACGDINPMTCVGYECPGSFEDAAKIAEILASESLRVFNRLKPSEPKVVRSSRKLVTLPLRKPPNLKEAEEELKRVEGEIKRRRAEGLDISDLRSRLIYARETYLLALEGLTEVEAEVQAFRIDDLAVVGFPGELLVGLGLRIKSKSPFNHTVVVGYANGYVGYIPSLEDFKRGGYEVHMARWSKLAPGAGELLVEEALALLEELSE